MGELLDELESTVKFLFQSAEESGHGSNYYVDHGCFEDIDAAMAMHVMNEIPSGMKKSEEMHLKSTIYESTLSTAGAVPLPRWGRERGGGFAAKKESQPRLAALGSPFQGKGLAWTLPPSYGRRCPEGAEVGWREAVFPYHSLPRVGKVASGASRIGY